MPPRPDVVIVDRQAQRDFVVDLSLYPASIVLTRKRRLHQTIWQPLFADYGAHRPLNFMEIGCQEGGASTWLLENYLGHPDSRMTAIDVFQPRVYETLLHNIAVGGWRDKVTVYRGKSGEVLRGLPLYSFDMIYVDGHHSSFAVIEDAVLAWRLLKNGGILLFDDYEWTGRGGMERPKPAIDFFLEAFEGQYELLVRAYQIGLRKTLAESAPEDYASGNPLGPLAEQPPTT